MFISPPSPYVLTLSSLYQTQDSGATLRLTLSPSHPFSPPAFSFDTSHSRGLQALFQVATAPSDGQRDIEALARKLVLYLAHSIFSTLTLKPPHVGPSVLSLALADTDECSIFRTH